VEASNSSVRFVENSSATHQQNPDSLERGNITCKIMTECYANGPFQCLEDLPLYSQVRSSASMLSRGSPWKTSAPM